MRRATVPAWDSRAAQTAQPVVSRSAPPRRLDGGNVDFLHRHHRLEGTLFLTDAEAGTGMTAKSSAIIRSERPCGEDTHQ